MPEKEEDLQTRAEPEEKEEKEIERTEKVRTSNLEDDLGFIKTTGTIPTEKPSHPLRRARLYVSGATKRLYVYDNKNDTWYFASLT